MQTNKHENDVKLSQTMYENAFASIPLGLIILNSQYQIKAWNDWMESKTKISRSQAVGKTLPMLFPEANYNRFQWALEQLFDFAAPQILSQILNHYLIPISLGENAYTQLPLMQQHVEMLPVGDDGDERLALIVIEDVTYNVHQRNVLMQMGKKFEEETYHDALTGVYNRRFLWGYLDKLIEWSKRESLSIGCVMFDLDYFKKINDQYGHDMGDQVITFFVNHVTKMIRPNDVFVRYGGEEFILLVSDVQLNYLIELCNRILSEFEKKSHVLIANVKLTCSAGIALWEPVKPYLSANQLIEGADKALYQAKKSGRNCVRF